jgi:RimJ/RimL family protein N-acetyltransferase
MSLLETPRLMLRKLTLDDAAFMLDLLNQPSFIQFIGNRGVRTLNDTRACVSNRYMVNYERFGFGIYLTALKETHAPIGICGLVKRDALEHVDIGYAFLPQYWSRGYAFEAASAVMAYAKNELGIERVVGIVTPENRASIRVLEKLGLRFERMVRLSEGEAELKLFA